MAFMPPFDRIYECLVLAGRIGNGKGELTKLMVGSSRRAMISQSRFPAPVSSKKHRWPIANFSKHLVSCLQISY